MYLWVDDIRPAPKGYIWARSVNEAKTIIEYYEHNISDEPMYINLDHDAGEFVKDGGDYVKILDWLEESGYVDKRYAFHFHTMNVVGFQNMAAICKKNNWMVI